MTREEAKSCICTIKMLQKLAYNTHIHGVMDVVDADNCKKIIKALEQEPCEDAISRQAAIDCLNADFTIDGKENMETVVDYINGAFKQIKALPSVTPQQKVGKWIIADNLKAAGHFYKCSECKHILAITDFCPNCGAKMESEE